MHEVGDKRNQTSVSVAFQGEIGWRISGRHRHAAWPLRMSENR